MTMRKLKQFRFSEKKKKIFKSMVSILTACSIIVSGISFNLLQVNAASSVGSGTLSDPYIITTAEQLALIATSGLSNCYKLGNNIDLSSYANWTPIGSSAAPFTGSFDGNGYTISNLTIGTSGNPSTLSYLGLFGYIGAATIKNVGVNASIYTSGSDVGGLVGYANGAATITGSFATGTVSGSVYVGGLVGYMYVQTNMTKATISNSYATDTVTGSNNYVGGLISYNMGSITNCYATGSVSGDSDIGGLAGCNDFNTITNSYATGNVTGTTNIGGLVGLNSSNVINSYAVGGVSGSSGVGGLVGNNNGSTVTDGYWNATIKSTGCGANSGTFTATGMASIDMQTQTFANTLTANIDSLNLSGCAGWKYSASINNGYPVLQGNGNGVSTTDTTPPTISTYSFQDYTAGTETIHATVTDDNSGIAVQKYAQGTQSASYFASNGTSFSSAILSGLTLGTYTIYAKDNAGNETTQVVTYTAVPGSGTSTDPYIITTALQLLEISTGLGKYYKLGNNIDLSSYTNWTPIGSSTAPFTGSFDGNGYTISNLTIGTSSCPSTSSYLGLFGYIGAATIKNVGVNASIYTSGSDVGGLVGYANGAATITGSFATGTVSGSAYVGGLVGYMYIQTNTIKATISNSYTTDTVTGSNNYVGGLISYNMGSITNCYANGNVSGDSDIGGLAGCNDYNTITNSYATGNVTGTSNIGGLVGLNSSNVINSYAVGGVSGSSGVGGLVGNNYDSTVTYGYWNATIESSGCGTNTGTFAATGMALANMQTQVFANTLTANIDSLNLSGCAGWKYSAGVNNGYPVLQGVGNGVSTTDTTPPTISTYAFQDYTSGTETIHATVTDDNSGIAIQKYAQGTQTASYFASNGTSFSSSILSGLTIGTYTIYAKDNAGNETTQVVTYTAVAGSGTSTDPYIITTPLQLAEVSTGLAKYYKLGNNIDLSSYTNWTPIGSSTAPFTGSFDGSGYTISNLTIGTLNNPSTSSYLGLFGYIGAATIKNVGVNASIYTSGSYVGGLVGFANGAATITGSFATGTVSGSAYVGGLVGYMYIQTNTIKATISNSYTTDTVTGSNNYVGGLISYNMGSITNCYATGSVSGISDIGGLAGCNDYNTITNSYATGNVTGTSNIGGLVGLNSSNVINSYAVGGVSGSSGVGGLVGNNYYYSSTDTATVTDGYWNATVKSTGCGTNTGTFAATGMALANMQTQVFANTLTANIDSLNLSGCAGWKYSTSINNGYPVLQGVGNGVSTTDTTPPTISTYAFQDFASGTETIHATVTDDDSGVAVQKYASGTQAVSYFASNGTSFSSSIISGLTIGTYTIYAKDNAGNETTQVVTYTAVAGSGTSTDPYIITTAYQLAEISTGLAKYYKLGNDIDLSSYANWTPIGSSTAPFTGSFDGSGYTISNLTIGISGNPSTSSYLGLFGYIGAATIKNVGVNASIYTSGNDVGSLVGYANGAATITSSFATGTVSGSADVGGVIGYRSTATAVISNSYATDTVTGSGNYVGGFIGYNMGSITNCYATGSVSGTSYLGGLAGYNSSTITNSYAAGSVTGTSYIGGFVGQNGGTITNSYATGAVAGTSYIGGLVGQNSSKIINSYANSFTAGSILGSSYAGGVVGTNSGTVTDGYWNKSAITSGYGTNTGTFTATGMALADMQAQAFVSTLNANITSLNLSGCVNWKCSSGINNGLPVLEGIGIGSATTDTTPPTISAYAFQDYTAGTETIHATVADDNSGIAVQKYAQGTQSASYFASNGTSFSSATISGLTIGTYTIYAEDNAGNETTQVVTYAAVAGSGTSTDPYIITTALQLAEISTGLAKFYKLGNSIDLSSYTNWMPIGSNAAPFTGSFDGNGYTISNLTIGTLNNPGTSSYLGLFGYISAATIKNVGVNASIYTSGSYVGGLVGYVNGVSTIAGSYVTGTVSGSADVGGLIGYRSTATAVISNSYATDTVTGSGNYVGGFIGYNLGAIADCYANGSVSGTSYLGGFAGYSSSTITNSYAAGSVTGTLYIGGLLGQNSGTIMNSYAVGSVLGTSYIGGLAGNNSSIITNSYAAGSTTGSSNTGGLTGANSGTVTDGYWNSTAISTGCGTNTGTFTATGMALASMQTQAFASILNANISSLNVTGCVDWKCSSAVNNELPVLQGVGDGTATTDTTPPTISAYEYQNFTNGTEAIHVNISDDNSGIAVQKILAGEETASDFQTGGTVFTGSTITNLTVGTYTIYAEDNAGNETVEVVTYSSAAGSGTVSNPYIITTAAQLSAISTGLGKSYKLGNNINLSEFTNWIPIGSSTAPFTGTFDGNGYTINNLIIGTPSSMAASSYLGLFGYISKATISNLGVYVSIYSNSNYIGGLVGESSNSSTVTNCYSSGTILGNDYIGGLVGYNVSSSSIAGSYSICSVSSSDNYAGGVVGYNYSTGTITNSYALGNVSGVSNVGGFAGSNGGTVTNSYASGNVSGVSDVGGLAGSNSGTVTNSFEKGSVSGTSSIGGFAGINSGSLINSYESGSVSGTSTIGGFVGSNSKVVTDCYYNSTANFISGSTGTAGMALSDMKAQSFADTLNANITSLNITNCLTWGYSSESNDSLPYLNGVADYNTNTDGTTTTTVTNSDGSTDIETYDGNGNLISDTNSVNGTTSYTYYSDGGKASETDPDGTVISYNSNGVMTSETDSGGITTSYIYDSNGDLLSENNAEDGITTYTYNSNGKLASETDPDGTISNYNNFGLATSVTYSDGSTTNYTYNDGGELISETNSNNGTTTYSYDSSGNFITETDPDNTITQFNSSGNPIKVTESDGTTMTYEYDSNGDLITMTDSTSGTTTYTYDSDHNLISSTDPDGTLVNYDSSGEVNSLTYADGRKVDFSYNSSGNLSSSIDSEFGTYSYIYDSGNNILTISKPNGQVINFDDSGFVTSIQNQTTSSTNAIDYTYDDQGNISTVSVNGTLMADYTYDGDNELEREDNLWANETITYSYDTDGNITVKTVYAYTAGALGSPINIYYYTYGNSSNPDQLTSYGAKTLVYDSNGNLTSYNGENYTWNNNDLVAITDTNNNFNYSYNSAGIRTSKTVNGLTTKYTLNNKNLIVSQTDGTNIINYIYDFNDNLAQISYNGTIYTYEKNLQGDIIGILDSSNDEVVTYSYDSWGNLISIDGSLKDTLGQANPFRFRGYYYDAETGLYYIQTRYYSPQFGRFISEDESIGYNDQTGIGANLYAYCDNNPINEIDIVGEKGISFMSILQYEVNLHIGGFYFSNGKLVVYWGTKAPQTYAGYDDFDDEVSESLSCRIKWLNVIIPNYKSKDWRIELWSGQYGPVYGGEIGIYYNGLNSQPNWYRAAYSNPLTMSVEIIKNKKNDLDLRTTKTSWINGFTPGFAKYEYLTLRVKMVFPQGEQDLRNLYVQYLSDYYNIKAGGNDLTVEFTWTTQGGGDK